MQVRKVEIKMFYSRKNNTCENESECLCVCVFVCVSVSVCVSVNVRVVVYSVGISQA